VGLAVYLALPTDDVIPVFRILMSEDGTGENGQPYAPFQQIRLNALALTAIDGQHRLYVVTRKRDRADDAPRMQVVRVDTDSHTIEPPVVLRRRTGEAVQFSCFFFAVSPSGKRWWTIRYPEEGVAAQQQKVLLAVHSQDGRTLQEWVLPVPGLAEVYNLMAPDEAMALLTIAGPASAEQYLAYTLGRALPSQLKTDWMLIDWMSLDGHVWGTRFGPPHSDRYTIVKYDASHTRSTPQRSFHASLNLPMIFAVAHDDIYFYDALYGVKNFLREDHAKQLYTISPAGELHPVLLTSAFSDRHSYKYGDFFCLDRQQRVLFDRMRYRDDKPDEYQIVKPSRLPRWQYWRMWLVR
jgi:hypothetical protein